VTVKDSGKNLRCGRVGIDIAVIIVSIRFDTIVNQKYAKKIPVF
jgi:hypothetical protein